MNCTACPKALKPSALWRSKEARQLFARFLALALASQVPSAFAMHCGRQITNSYVDAGGSVVILGTWGSGYQQICNVNATWNNVSPTTCKGWLSVVELVTATGKTAILDMSDAVTSCSTIPGYASSPAPVYVMLQQ
ncbi:MAG: hypothetical protein JSR59_24670 [Proteobacteria bacterium]|nr:hypothetical protein [Pseudomonadota bacterium]